MHFLKKASFSFLLIIISSCKEAQIVGHWQLINAKNGTGDLIIRADSTFLIKGPPKNMVTDTIPGWHLSDMEGNWQRPDKKHLMLIFKEEYDFKFRFHQMDSICYFSNKKLELLIDKQFQRNYIRVKK